MRMRIFNVQSKTDRKPVYSTIKTELKGLMGETGKKTTPTEQSGVRDSSLTGIGWGLCWGGFLENISFELR